MFRPYLINHFLENSSRQYPDKPAVWYKDKWMTYAEIDFLADKIASYIARIGLHRGDKAALLFDNSFDYIICYFGILKAGCVVVALNTDTRVESLIYQLIDSDAKLIFAHGKFSKYVLPALEKTPYLGHAVIDAADITPYKIIGHCNTVTLQDIYDSVSRTVSGPSVIDADLAAIVYTSGSTGRPKGVMLTHLNLVSNMCSIVSYLRLTRDDSIMVILPFFYIYGKSLLLTHFLAGGSVVIDNRFMYPNKVLEAMKEHNVTGFAGVPSTFSILLNKSSLAGMTFPALRYVTQAGGAMAPAIQKQVADSFKGAELFIMYGSTEASPRLSYLDPDKLSSKMGSIGKAIPNVDLYVADEEGRALPPGETGEIVARGSNIFKGYWKDHESTGQVLRDGIYYSGDLGKTDDEGYIYVVGRKKDIIKVKGYRVSAREIEEAILELNDVHEVAVIGIEDPLLGEAVKAYVVPKDKSSFSIDKVHSYLAGKLAVYKRPSHIEVIDELPKNQSGKIMKTMLIERNKNEKQ
jgi:long-chain acyl-CoA synthetase